MTRAIQIHRFLPIALLGCALPLNAYAGGIERGKTAASDATLYIEMTGAGTITENAPPHHADRGPRSGPNAVGRGGAVRGSPHTQDDNPAPRRQPAAVRSRDAQGSGSETNRRPGPGTDPKTGGETGGTETRTRTEAGSRQARRTAGAEAGSRAQGRAETRAGAEAGRRPGAARSGSLHWQYGSRLRRLPRTGRGSRRILRHRPRRCRLAEARTRGALRPAILHRPFRGHARRMVGLRRRRRVRGPTLWGNRGRRPIAIRSAGSISAMPNTMCGGFPARPARPTACPPRRNGSMPRAPAPRPSSGGANDIGRNNANCFGCGSRWDGTGPAPRRILRTQSARPPRYLGKCLGMGGRLLRGRRLCHPHGLSGSGPRRPLL